MKILSNLLMAILVILAPINSVIIATFVLVLSDLIIGLIAAKKRGEKITSKGLRRTITKMLVYEVLIILGFITESYLIGHTLPLCRIISGFIGLTEITSLIESLNDISGKNLLKGLVGHLSKKE